MKLMPDEFASFLGHPRGFSQFAWVRRAQETLVVQRRLELGGRGRASKLVDITFAVFQHSREPHLPCCGWRQPRSRVSEERECGCGVRNCRAWTWRPIQAFSATPKPQPADIFVVRLKSWRRQTKSCSRARKLQPPDIFVVRLKSWRQQTKSYSRVRGSRPPYIFVSRLSRGRRLGGVARRGREAQTAVQPHLSALGRAILEREALERVRVGSTGLGDLTVERSGRG
jgi:hypothetical protein